MARCGCSDTGASSVRSMLSAQDGVKYNSLTGVFSADISVQPGNNLSLDAFGKLFVPTGAATVTTGAGLLGIGTGGNPVRANVAAWPYVTAPVTGAQGVFVNPVGGQLVSPPIQVANLVQSTITRNYANLAVNTTASPVTADTFVVTLTNPDPNRSCVVIISREVKMRFGLPVNSQASFSIDGVDVGRQWNFGGTAVSAGGVTQTKMFKSANLGPGASSSYTLTVGTLNGTGASTYSRIDVDINVLYIGQ